ncbi:MAG: hypothetical protein ABL964_14270, partial [Steroidobacteraceae bacterium]
MTGFVTRSSSVYIHAAMHAFLHRCLSRTPIIGLLMAALLFRALVPAGFMPAQAENGEIVMQLCSGFSTKSVVVDLGTSGATHDSSTQLFDHSPCGFAAAAQAAPPPASMAFAANSTPESLTTRADSGTVIAPTRTRAHS